MQVGADYALLPPALFCTTQRLCTPLGSVAWLCSPVLGSVFPQMLATSRKARERRRLSNVGGAEAGIPPPRTPSTAALTAADTAGRRFHATDHPMQQVSGSQSKSPLGCQPGWLGSRRSPDHGPARDSAAEGMASASESRFSSETNPMAALSERPPASLSDLLSWLAGASACASQPA